MRYMNTAKLKTFAPKVRRQLMEAVSRRLDVVLAGQTADLQAKEKQRKELEKRAAVNYPGLIEQVAYTWFNRLAALRFFDARGWHPFRVRVITAAGPGETQPELLKLVRLGTLPDELIPFTDPKRLNYLLDGRLSSPDPQGEVYRHLVLAACRFYHNLMPFLFEKLDDATELLLPEDLLTPLSIVQGFRTEISDEDCREVELLGWLYQFYISEKKDQVMARKSAVPAKDIPAVTQLFTPHWIVRYLVENSLGRLWLNSRPNSRLKERMPYYVADPEGAPPREKLTVDRPEEIKINDPACGSGHMLTYAFDLLYQIYEEEGYSPTEIPKKILRHNLYGIEICPRAGQLAQLALVCKAREYDRKFFSNPSQPHICVLENIRFEEEELDRYMEAVGRDLFTAPLQETLRQFEEANNYGSLIRPEVTDVAAILKLLESKDISEDLLLHNINYRVIQALEQTDYLSQKYHVVVTNPPYLGGRAMNKQLVGWLKDNYPDVKADLFSSFVVRCAGLGVSSSYSGIMSPNVWMYISSYERLRIFITERKTLTNLVELPLSGFKGATVQICAYNFENVNSPNFMGGFVRLVGFKGGDKEMSAKTREAISNPDCDWLFRASASDFNKIPGSPIAYWLTREFLSVFGSGVPMQQYAVPRQGFATGDNDRFLRQWHEVDYRNIKTNAKSAQDARASGARWFPCNKGGQYRKWYGNNNFIADWLNDGADMRSYSGSVIRNPNYYFREGITWSTISSSLLSMRYSPKGFIFETKGSVCFPLEGNSYQIPLALMNTKVVEKLLLAISPTLDFHEGPIGKVPVIETSSEKIIKISDEAIECAKTDWDSYETSWDFTNLPLLSSDYRQAQLNFSYAELRAHWRKMTAKMQQLEEENNRIFIVAYGLQDELAPEVPLKEITLTCNPHYRYGGNKSEAELEEKMLADTMKEFLSYAVGCMMGRYSLDKPGLILANAGDTLANYLSIVGRSIEELSFVPDQDGIIPFLDDEWFEDDVVARVREFLRGTFGEDTLEENIRFLEEALGKDLRKYFLSEFYKDHLKTYKKRPIYWIFQSPKKGFSALIYMHRYTRDTVNIILNRYLREFMHKLRSRLDHLEHLSAGADSSAREKSRAVKETEKIRKLLRECEEYEHDVLLPIAQQRIEIDLDDGVKVNYLKFGNALAPIPGLNPK